MFGKILIANRGEIAVRIARACRDLGVRSAAVYSEADRGALHVRVADEAWPCGPPRATESYLAIDRLLDIARRAGADAVHPGYGFLSENGDFAEACARRGLVFIGPDPDVLRRMGDKVTSRRLMRQAGVAVVPGSDEALDDEAAHAYALELGLPVMVKASGGGGGRGLRRVAEEKDLRPAIERARSEAASAFGSDAIYVEKWLEDPRHIEVQVLRDAAGHCVHVFERECSVQRRHQKLLEEAPANVSAAMRSALGAAAVRAADATGYRGAGTIEFLVDAAGDFYFLEMNTRIQVEHPVTEEIASIDLVKEMIRIAAGEPLDVRQSDLAIRGHAMEARIYAEDPARGFLPSPGRVVVFRPPAGAGIRVDAGVQAGDLVTPHYDALLAKVVAWGRDRDEALARLDRALHEFRVAGVRTTIPFQRRVLRQPAFVAGRYDTGLALAVASEDEGDRAARAARDAALALVAITCGEEALPRRVGLRSKGSEARDHEVVVHVPSEGGDALVTVDGRRLQLEVHPEPAEAGGVYSLVEAGCQHEACVVEKRPGRFEVGIGDRVFTIERIAPAPS